MLDEGKASPRTPEEPIYMARGLNSFMKTRAILPIPPVGEEQSKPTTATATTEGEKTTGSTSNQGETDGNTAVSPPIAPPTGL